MNAKTRRAFSVFVCLMVFLSIASYGGLAAAFQPEDLKLNDSVSLSGNTSGRLNGVAWGPDGNVLFVATADAAEIVQYNASSPYDIDSLTFVDKISHSEVNGPQALEVGPEGKRLYLSEAINNNVEQYNMSDPLNISTATHVKTLSLDNEGTNNFGIEFNETGEQLYVVFADSPAKIQTYELSDPYDLSTASALRSVSDSSIDRPRGIEFNKNGTIMYVIEDDTGESDLETFDLSEAWNISTKSARTTFDVSGETDSPGFLDWKPEGDFLYMSDQGSTIYEYTTKNHTISGTVKNGAGGAIEGATVTLNTTGGETVTNSSGFYQFAVDNGTHKVTGSFEDLKENSTTVVVNGSDVTGADITLFEKANLSIEAPSHMWHNQTDSVVVKDGETDITDNATLTSSNTDLLTVSDDGTLESTSNLSRNGEVEITATFEGGSVSENVTVANLSAEHANLMQNAADMTAALWGDPIHPETGERQGGTQLTMRIIFVATLVGAGFANKINGFAGVAGFLLVITAGWFMNWIGLGLLLLTVVGTLFVGLNTAQLRSRRFGA